MRRRDRAAWVVMVMVLGASPGAGAGDEAPEWIEAARRSPVSTKGGKPALGVLFEEQMVEVARSDTRKRVRMAVKVLTVEGRGQLPLAAAQSVGEEFKLHGGWRIRPDGEVTRYGTKTLVQLAPDGRLSFNQSKVNTFWPDEIRAGDVVAWEYEVRSKPEAYFESWRFGGSWPTARSRFGLKAPAEWTVRSTLRNTPEISPAKDDEGFLIWEMKDVEPIREEPMMSPVGTLAPSLVVSYAPAGGKLSAAHFDSWRSVARWYDEIVRAQVVSDQALRSAAREAAAGAATPVDQIRSVARFVQAIRYLNVAVGRSVAEPHPATQILKNRFGDCEDKSVLSIAMLRELAVEAYPVLALTSDEGAVEPDFPAPNQFNHAIVAIRAPEGFDAPSIVEAGPLGRLVIFDPTSTVTGFGDLPDYLQGTRGVLVHSDHGALIDLPVLPPEASSRESDVAIRFAPAGGVEVTAEVTYRGQYAADEREYYAATPGARRKEDLTSYLAGHHGRASVRRLEVSGLEAPEAPVVVRMEIAMALPGRDAGSLRTLSPHFLLGTRAPRLQDSKRVTPLRITAGIRETDRVKVEAPAGWRLLDPIPSASVAGDIGSYELRGAKEGAGLTLERTFTLKAGTVPPARYGPVKQFLDQVLKADSASVALEKEAP